MALDSRRLILGAEAINRDDVYITYMITVIVSLYTHKFQCHVYIYIIYIWHYGQTPPDVYYYMTYITQLYTDIIRYHYGTLDSPGF